jgi:hypothetical protein
VPQGVTAAVAVMDFNQTTFGRYLLFDKLSKSLALAPTAADGLAPPGETGVLHRETAVDTAGFYLLL